MRLSRSFRWFAVTGLVVAPIGIATTVHAGDTEVLRIRAHFDSVLIELSARDLRGLSPAQRSHRAALIRESTYRVRGVFPPTTTLPAQRRFRRPKDGGGAVANLLARTGRRDIVDRVARANNNVWSPSSPATRPCERLANNDAEKPHSGRTCSRPMPRSRAKTFGLVGRGDHAATTSIWFHRQPTDIESAQFGVVSGTTSLIAGALIEKRR
jgi:hypothetical protein